MTATQPILGAGPAPGGGPPALLFVAFLLFISLAAPQGPRKRTRGYSKRYTRPGKARLSERPTWRGRGGVKRRLQRRVGGRRRDEHEGDRHQERPHGDAV